MHRRLFAQRTRFFSGSALAVCLLLDPPMREDGFSLLEAVVASAILITGVFSLAQLVVSTSRAAAASDARSLAAMLVIDKMEQLRGLRWTVDAGGLPANDPGLAPSPGDALERDAPGYADAPGGCTRRWLVQPLPSDSTDTLVLQVRVITPGGAEARMTTVRTRQAN